jgi:hypothetical protein
MTTRIDALIAKLKRSLAANSTDVAFASVITGRLPPTDAFDLAFDMSGVGHGAMFLMPFAIGAAGVTFSIRVMGFKQIGTDPNTLLWVPLELYEADCIAGTDHGLAGAQVLDTEFFASTITLVFGTSNVSSETVSPANNNNGHICLDTKGCRYIKTLFKMGTASSGNCLLCPF